MKMMSLETGPVRWNHLLDLCRTKCIYFTPQLIRSLGEKGQSALVFPYARISLETTSGPIDMEFPRQDKAFRRILHRDVGQFCECRYKSRKVT